MRNGLNSLGYTIMEVMIFLAISGVMFIIAVGFVSGKQSRAEFKQGLNNIRSQVQEVVNNVSNGQYPSNGNFSCQATATGPRFSLTPAGQGSNQDCMYLGQVIQFGVNGTGDIGYNIYTVAGNRCAPPSISPCNTDNLSTNLANAKPVAVYTPADLTQQKNLEWGMQVTGVYNVSSVSPQICTITGGGWTFGPSAAACSLWTTTFHGSLTNGATATLFGITFTLTISGGGVGGSSIGAIGFFNSLANYGIGGVSSSGPQSTLVAAVPHSALEEDEPTMVGHINQTSDTDIANHPNFVICLQNGNQKGSITIGGGGGQRLTVTQQVGANGACP